MEGSLLFDLLPQVKTETRSQKYLQCKFHLSSLLRSGLTGMFFLLQEDVFPSCRRAYWGPVGSPLRVPSWTRQPKASPWRWDGVSSEVGAEFALAGGRLTNFLPLDGL